MTPFVIYLPAKRRGNCVRFDASVHLKSGGEAFGDAPSIQTVRGAAPDMVMREQEVVGIVYTIS